jgi:TolB-like protein/class 3 adenylate cyclase
MAETRVERRLAAILAADVAGYSRLMGADEVGTLTALKAHRREVVDPAIAQHHGRIVKTTGDGMLVEFASAVDAVTCAVEVQEKMAEQAAEGTGPRIQFRVGINIGDILIDGDDIFGDGVNVAARVENECKPGGVCLSDDAYRQVRGKTALAFDDLGEMLLKNIDRPVRIYAARSTTYSGAAAVKASANEGKPLPLPDKPSIAVLPFTNMSGDPEQEYFAEGVVEDIITALSHFGQLFVIARNSSFTYKGKAVDVKLVGRELGVRYVLEGSVRKFGSRVRITGQLIDASSGAHLWAERFEGSLEDIFELQDQVTASVVGQIAPKIEQAEIERTKRKPTDSLGAYDYFLRGMAVHYHMTMEANEESLRLFYRAIELDSDFAAPYGLAAECIGLRKANRWETDRARDIREIERLAKCVVRLGRDDALALYTTALSVAYLVGDLDAGASMVDRALSLNPNLAWRVSCWIRVWIGNPEIALEHISRAMRLNPRDPYFFGMQAVAAFAHFFAGRYDEASSWAEAALQDAPNFHQALRMAAAGHALAGRLEMAEKAMTRLRQIDPDLRVSNLFALTPLRRVQDVASYQEGLRRAGLPE